MRQILMVSLLTLISAKNSNAAVNANDSATPVPSENTSDIDPGTENQCAYDCLELGTSYLRPTGVARNFLDRGTEVSIWYRPRELKILDDIIFKSLNIPIWKNIRLNTGLYWNKFTGQDYDRRYLSTGVSIGALWHLNLNERHSIFAQGDFRFGGAYAHRTGADSSSANIQPVIFGGYNFNFSGGFVGIVAESMLSSDKSPLIAVGPSLRIGFNLGPQKSSPAPAVMPQPVKTLETVEIVKPSLPVIPATQPLVGTYVEVLPDGASVTMPTSRVSFAVGQGKLDANGDRYMTQFAKIIAGVNADWQKFEVTGHTDKRGPEAINLRISKGRANAVAAKLKSAGVSASKIVVVGRGSSDTLDNGDSESAHAKNRRVVIRIYGDKSGDKIAQKILDFEREFANSN